MGAWITLTLSDGRLRMGAWIRPKHLDAIPLNIDESPSRTVPNSPETVAVEEASQATAADSVEPDSVALGSD